MSQADKPHDGSSPPPPSSPPRRRWLRWAVDITIVLAIVFAVQAWRTRDVPDTPLTDFAFVTHTGEWSSFAHWRAGQPEGAAVIYFWADWCAICRTVEGTLDGIADDWPLLSVAMQSGTPETVAKTLAERALSWDTAVDADGRLSAAFGVHGVPTMLIIDQENRVRFAEVGLRSGPGLRLRLWWANRS